MLRSISLKAYIGSDLIKRLVKVARKRCRLSHKVRLDIVHEQRSWNNDIVRNQIICIENL